ncbi:hypothetical protein D3C77_508100 [compost metagenome]
MGSKMVILDHAAPMRIHHALAVFPRPDTVLPVILISEAASRPAQNRYFDLLQCFQNVIANSLRIGDRGIFPYPNPLINTSAKMLREMTVNVLIDGSFANIRVDDHIVLQSDALQIFLSLSFSEFTTERQFVSEYAARPARVPQSSASHPRSNGRFGLVYAG